MSYAVAKERAALGRAFLDENVPGWRDRIDPLRLNMGSCEWCLLGQRFGHFDYGYKELRERFGLQGNWTVDLGFNSDKQVGFRELTRAWKEEYAIPAETPPGTRPGNKPGGRVIA